MYSRKLWLWPAVLGVAREGVALVSSLPVIPPVSPVVVVVLDVVVGVDLPLLLILHDGNRLVVGKNLKLLLVGDHPVVDVLAQHDL